jgi:CPA2 family monovalent cation:H+ antiporter-2
MTIESYKLKIVLIFTFGFALASLLSYVFQRLKLPSILGYLIAGYLIGPFSPGFVADLELSEQLAEIGVILMMFGLGLHFKINDLFNVRRIAIPGAIGQTAIATLAGTLLVYWIGWPIEYGIIIGLSIGVASTVVLVRMLSEYNLLNTIQGHIAVGWLIVEDLLTVAVLVLLPLIDAAFKGNDFSLTSVMNSIILAFLKFILLIIIMFTWGRKVVTSIMVNIARFRSHELFTLTILALTFLIATGSALVFGTSIALGAFIAGIVIGQTHVRYQAAANALPMKDIFQVVFFLSVGMLFNPFAIIENFTLFIGILAIILIIKPLTALLIVLGLGMSLEVALIVSIALAQIGEFSFILAEEASRLDILLDEGYDIIVACAIVSISLNSFLFKGLEYFKKIIARLSDSTSSKQTIDMSLWSQDRLAIVVGFGPIGQHANHLLEQKGFKTIIIDRNIDTIADLTREGRQAVYGDASLPNILESVHLEKASLLVTTISDLAATASMIQIARQFNPQLKMIVRTQYISEQAELQQENVKCICGEEETKKAFIEAVSKWIR